jgi:hypothetical protein
VNSKSWPLLGILVILAMTTACGNGSGNDPDAGDRDPGIDSAHPDDGALDDAFDAVYTDTIDTGTDQGPDDPGSQPDDGDIPGDAEGDEGRPPPDHEMTFEQRNHPGCLPDGPYEVDRVDMFRTTEALADLDSRAILAAGDRTWVGTATGLFTAEAGATAFTRVALPDDPQPVQDLAFLNDTILVTRGNTVVSVDDSGNILATWTASATVDRVFPCDGQIFGVLGGGLFRAQDDAFQAVSPAPDGVVLDGACLGDQPMVGTTLGLWTLDDGTWHRAWNPGDAVVAVAARGTLVAAATVNDVAILDGDEPLETWTPGPGSLPNGQVTALDISDDGNRVAVGHAIGVTLVHRDSGIIEHFHSMRWIPGQTVAAVSLSPGSQPDMLVATPGGVSRLWKYQTTLQAKAERMMEQLDRWFWRLDGFVSANAGFPDPWSDGPSKLWDDDNDGQWTQEAVGAFCYAWAATGDERYHQAARKAITNMTMQIDIPAQDFIDAGLGRGFITRSFVRDDEGDVFTSKATQSNWHRVEYSDGHVYYWKDDTSSDEVIGHFYGFSIYHDLCARDDQERAWVGGYLVELAGYILDHGFTLPDLGGIPTTHGNWSPGRLAVAVDGLEPCMEAGWDLEWCIDAWGGGAFLDSLQILGGMLAAWHVSGDQRFLDAYEELISVHRYDELAMFNENVATWTVFPLANYCDHELADLAFLTLLRYEPYPDRRQHWIESTMAAWEHEIGERNPLKSLTMGASVQNPPGLAEGIRTLVEYPEDLRQLLVDNSHRVDARRGGTDRHGRAQFTTVLPYDEMAVMRWDSNPYTISYGGSANLRRAPNFWLLPYWGLRYYNLICPVP